MNSIVTNKINQMLWERKRERKKVDAYRNKRIKSRYEKTRDEQLEKGQAQQPYQNVQDKRKIDFYNQVFGQEPSAQAKEPRIKSNIPNRQQIDATFQQDLQSKKIVEGSFNKLDNISKRKQEHVKNKQFLKNGSRPQRSDVEDKRMSEVEKMQKKSGKLKDRKKKIIKKLQQRTKKGQPVMRNYIKYALTKIEENILKQKLDKECPPSSAKTKGQKNYQFTKNRIEGREFTKFMNQQDKK